MSHAASLAAVFLLNCSIALDIVALVTNWWDASHIAVHDETAEVSKCEVSLTLWDIEMKSSHPVPLSVLGVAKKDGNGYKITQSWDDFCNRASLSGGETGWCGMITGMRALIILAAIFSFIGGVGVAIGNYTGNTLIDAGSGFVGNVGNLCGLVAIIISVSMNIDDLYLAALKEAWGEKRTFGAAEKDGGPGRDGVTIGFGILIGACVAQFLGGVFACIGTCQEIREVAAIAAVYKTGQDAMEGGPRTRAERAHVEHDKDDALAREKYANLKKRQEAGDPYASNSEEKKKNEPSEGTDVEKPKRRLYKLEKVLFRSPESDEDDIPTDDLIQAFHEIDCDTSGSIEMEELIEALSDCNINVSKTAADTIMKEIDKNASGDIDMREFIAFFRHIEELKRFDQKNKARQQFASFLANFCFLADVVVVGVMLMLFINMDEAEDPDTYAITKNVMMACIVLLCVLFILVIIFPILRLSLGPTASKMQKQYDLAKEIRKMAKKIDAEDDSGNSGPSRFVYSPSDPPPPVNAAQFGRSYRPQMVTKNAWSQPQQTLMPAQPQQRPSATPSAIQDHSQAPLALQDSVHQSPTHTTSGTHPSHGHEVAHSHGHVRKGNFQYNPDYYAQARLHAESVMQQNQGPMSWSPMQIRAPGQNGQAEIMQPGVPNALVSASMPTNMIR